MTGDNTKWNYGGSNAEPKGSFMRHKTLLSVLASVIFGTAFAQQPKVTSLLSKELKETPEKEGLMILVEYPPGGADQIHRHNSHGFIYVLDGSVVMQVKGGNEVTLTAGQTFHEGPDDEHVVGRNASSTTPAKFLVFLVKDKQLRYLFRQSD